MISTKLNFITIFLSLFCCIAILSSGTAQEGYHIDVQMDNANSDTLYLAYFYGDAQYIKDTAYRQGDAPFTFQGKEPLPEGVYMFVLPPDNSFFQVLIDDDQTFTMRTDAKNVTGNTVIEGSEDNTIFYDYLGLIDQSRKKKTKEI